MGFGAGLGAFAQGLASGLKTASDLADAEERRGLTRIQKEAAQMQVDSMKDERAYAEARKKIFNPDPAVDQSNTGATTSSGGLRNPSTYTAPDDGPAPSGNNPSGYIAPQGIAPPGGQAGGQPTAPQSDFEKMMGQWQALNKLDMEYGKLSPLDALKKGREFQKLQQEGFIDAFRHYAATRDEAGSLKIFNQFGAQAPEGTRFETVDRELIPGVKDSKQTDYVAVLPNGQRISYMDTMRNALDPKDLADINTKTGLGIAELRIKQMAEERQERQGERLYELTKMHYSNILEQQRAQTAIALERLGLAKDEARYVKTQQAFNGAYVDIANTVGVQKGYKDELASPEQRAAQSQALAKASVAQSVFEMNFDLKTGKPNISPQQAIQVSQYVAANRDKIQQDPETGFSFIEMGNKKYFIPGSPKPAAAPSPAPGQAPSPGQAPARAAAPAPAPAPNREADSLPQPVQEAGLRLDAARQRQSQAQASLQRFGLRQRAADPQGYAAAQSALEQANRDVSEATQQYQSLLPAGVNQPAFGLRVR